MIGLSLMPPEKDFFCLSEKFKSTDISFSPTHALPSVSKTVFLLKQLAVRIVRARTYVAVRYQFLFL